MKIMKDSGIEWIKEIPVSWNIIRGKNILNIHKRPYSNDCEVVTCFRDGQVTLRSNRREEGFTFADKEIGYQGVKTGDLVIHGMDGFAGAIGISDSDGKASPVLNVCTPKQNYSTKFLMYYLRMLATQNVFIALATGIRERSCDLRWNKIAELLFPITTEMEQTAIADYLDDKCGKIDATIQREKQHIEKLKEYRQSVITEAVTKGLDPTVPMKDSGIEWIGEIPQGWKVGKINSYLSLLTDYTANGSFADLSKNVIYLDFENYARLVRLTDLRVNFENPGVYVSKESYEYLSKSSLTGGEILMANVGAYAGFSFEMPTVIYKTTLAPNMFLLKFNDNYCNNHFIYYLLNSETVLNQLILKANSTSAQPKLNKQDVRSVYCVYPEIVTQTAIADYLDHKTAQIDSAIAKKETLIGKLNEYKKSLIYEAVTGKVEIS